MKFGLRTMTPWCLILLFVAYCQASSSSLLHFASSDYYGAVATDESSVFENINSTYRRHAARSLAFGTSYV